MRVLLLAAALSVLITNVTANDYFADMAAVTKQEIFMNRNQMRKAVEDKYIFGIDMNSLTEPRSSLIRTTGSSEVKGLKDAFKLGPSKLGLFGRFSSKWPIASFGTPACSDDGASLLLPIWKARDKEAPSSTFVLDVKVYGASPSPLFVKISGVYKKIRVLQKHLQSCTNNRAHVCLDGYFSKGSDSDDRTPARLRLVPLGTVGQNGKPNIRNARAWTNVALLEHLIAKASAVCAAGENNGPPSISRNGADARNVREIMQQEARSVDGGVHDRSVRSILRDEADELTALERSDRSKFQVKKILESEADN